MIHIHDEESYIKYAFKEIRRLYKVVATVGKQDHPFDYESRDGSGIIGIWTRGVRVDGASDAVALIPLDHLLEDVVKRLFPRSFKFFEEQRNKSLERPLEKEVKR